MNSWGRKSFIFDQQQLIGEGAYSKVYRSNKMSVGSGETTAVKVYNKSKMTSDTIEHAKREKNILKNIDSEYVCSYRDSLESKNKLYVIQKYEEGRTLEEILEKKRKLNSRDVLLIAKALLKGLEYLHSRRVMHRDLKPANIIYNSKKNKAVLLDLGFACYLHKNDDRVLTSTVGTPNYMSPEILRGKRYNSQSDVWSFGVIIYELLTGDLPFHGRSEKEIVQSIFNNTVKFKISYHPTLEFIIQQCLKTNPEERITWVQLFEWQKTGKVPESKQSKKASRLRCKRDSERRDLISNLSEKDRIAESCMCSLF